MNTAMIIVLLLVNAPLIFAATNLQNQCNKPLSTYFGTSCLILHTEQKRYNTAKISCNDILGYSGHLVHIRSLDYQPVIESLMVSRLTFQPMINGSFVECQQHLNCLDWHRMLRYMYNIKSYWLVLYNTYKEIRRKCYIHCMV